MVEPGISRQISERSAETRLGIGCSEHQAIDARIDQGTGAHGAGLERDVKRTAAEPPSVASSSSGLADGENLGVSQRIAVELAPIVRAG